MFFSLLPEGGGGEEAVADAAVEAFALEAVGVAELDEGLGIEGVAGAKAVAGEEVGDGVVFRGEGVKKVYGAVGEGEVVVTGADCRGTIVFMAREHIEARLRCSGTRAAGAEKL